MVLTWHISKNLVFNIVQVQKTRYFDIYHCIYNILQWYFNDKHHGTCPKKRNNFLLVLSNLTHHNQVYLWASISLYLDCSGRWCWGGLGLPMWCGSCISDREGVADFPTTDRWRSYCSVKSIVAGYFPQQWVWQPLFRQLLIWKFFSEEEMFFLSSQTALKMCLGWKLQF